MFGLFSDSAATDLRVTDEGSRNGYLVFSDDGITFHADFVRGGSRTFEKGVIVDVVLDVAVETSQRYTFTRLFFFKLYALAFPKRTSKERVNLYIIMTDGSEAVFALHSANSAEVHQRIQPYVEQYRLAAPQQELSIARELGRLHELHMTGALTDDEFVRAKEQLLGKARP